MSDRPLDPPHSAVRGEASDADVLAFMHQAFGDGVKVDATTQQRSEHRVLRGHTLRAGPNAIELGPAFLLNFEVIEPSTDPIPSGQKVLEEHKLREAIMTVQGQLDNAHKIGLQNVGKKLADILRFPRAVVGESNFLNKCLALIENSCYSAAAALSHECREFQKALQGKGHSFASQKLFDSAAQFFARAEDIEDLRCRLLLTLEGKEPPDTRLARISEPQVIAAKTIGPSHSVLLKPGMVKAIATEERLGDSGHVVLLAERLDVPLIVGVPDLTRICTDGDTILINDNTETVEINPPEDVIDQQIARAKLLGDSKKEISLKERDSITKDGVKITLMGAIANKWEVDRVLASGVSGVGLFRSEFVFMDQGRLHVSEEDQKLIFQAIVDACTDNNSQSAVILRLLDFGSDKVSLLSQGSSLFSSETNPALGIRGVRFALQHQHILRPHINAVLRAAHYGKGRVHMLVPFVDGPKDMQTIRQITNEQIEELRQRGASSGRIINYDPNIKIGAMIETISAAWGIKNVLKYSDFVSFGSTDLLQYFYSTDREGSMLSHKRRFEGPEFISFVRDTMQKIEEFNAALPHDQKRPIYFCGQAASKVEFYPIILGLGFTNISVSARRAGRLNYIINKLAVDQCRGLVDEMCQAENADQSAELLFAFWKRLGMERVQL